jgi:hypothetical protein
LYEEGSKAKELIQFIHDKFYLVHVVENDYINADLGQTILNVIEKVKPINRYIEIDIPSNEDEPVVESS